MQLLAMLCGLGSLVCWIIVLVALFKKEGVLLGLLGIVCGIYAYIWGWINVKSQNLNKVMLIWTACIVGSIIFNILAPPTLGPGMLPGTPTEAVP